MVTIISIHAPHTGRDHGLQRQLLRQEGFQSTRPIRGATPFLYTLPLPRLYFNPRAPYGARLQAVAHHGQLFDISIHAPHTGRDRCLAYNEGQCSEFQSTRPIRGATVPAGAVPPGGHISIHAPHTGRDQIYPFQAVRRRCISIHAPHTGRDINHLTARRGIGHFNPRAPYGARQ